MRRIYLPVGFYKQSNFRHPSNDITKSTNNKIIEFCNLISASEPTAVHNYQFIILYYKYEIPCKFHARPMEQLEYIAQSLFLHIILLAVTPTSNVKLGQK